MAELGFLAERVVPDGQSSHTLWLVELGFLAERVVPDGQSSHPLWLAELDFIAGRLVPDGQSSHTLWLAQLGFMAERVVTDGQSGPTLRARSTNGRLGFVLELSIQSECTIATAIDLPPLSPPPSLIAPI